jgi:antitoxin HicB
MLNVQFPLFFIPPLGSPFTVGQPHRADAVCDGGTGNCAAARLHQETAKDAAGRTGIGEETQKTIFTKPMSKKTHRGSDFRDFLDEQGILGEVEARALKQALSLQLDRLLKEKELTKTQMAARMKTSRAAVDRLLNRAVTKALMSSRIMSSASPKSEKLFRSNVTKNPSRAQFWTNSAGRYTITKQSAARSSRSGNLPRAAKMRPSSLVRRPSH